MFGQELKVKLSFSVGFRDSGLSVPTKVKSCHDVITRFKSLKKTHLMSEIIIKDDNICNCIVQCISYI